jgi:hypothetical protein
MTPAEGMGCTHPPFFRHFDALFLLDLGVLEVVVSGRGLPLILLHLDGLGLEDAFSLLHVMPQAPHQLDVSCALYLLGILPFAVFRPRCPTRQQFKQEGKKQ